MNAARRSDSAGRIAVDGTCQRNPTGCTTAYSDAPAACAAALAIWSVPASRLPPWNAMIPNGERSSHTSSTPSWARSSANIGPPVVHDIRRHADHDRDERDGHEVLVVLQPALHAGGPIGHSLDRGIVSVAADLDPPVPRDIGTGEHEQPASDAVHVRQHATDRVHQR